MRSLHAAIMVTVLLTTDTSAQSPVIGFECGSIMSARNVAMALERRGIDAAIFETKKRDDCFVVTVSRGDLVRMNELRQTTFPQVRVFVRFEEVGDRVVVVPNLTGRNETLSGQAT